MITETFSNRCLMVSKSLHHLKVCLHNKFWSHICIIMRPQLKNFIWQSLVCLHRHTDRMQQRSFWNKIVLSLRFKNEQRNRTWQRLFRVVCYSITVCTKNFFKKLFNKKGEGGTFPQKTAKLRLYSLNGINQKTSTTKYMLDSLLNSKLLRQILTDILGQ